MARILIIDDEAAVLRLIQRMLEKVGHVTLTAGDGAEGLRLFREEVVELVITDLFMPGMEGIETIQALRDIHPEVPILAISGALTGDALDPLGDAEALGANASLAKPFTMPQLIRAVEGLLGQA